jgi:hypothetical protein
MIMGDGRGISVLILYCPIEEIRSVGSVLHDCMGIAFPVLRSLPQSEQPSQEILAVFLVVHSLTFV